LNLSLRMIDFFGFFEIKVNFSSQGCFRGHQDSPVKL
jgi:hypothetical protein